VHPADTENDFDNEPRKSNADTVQRESHPPPNVFTSRIRRCSSPSTCEDKRTGSIGVVLGDGSAHAHSSVCSSAPSDIGTVHDGHVSWEDSDEYGPDSMYMMQNELRWPVLIGDESDFDDRVVSEWLEKILHVDIGSLGKCQESQKQDDILTRCVGGTRSGEFYHNEEKTELEESNNSLGGLMNHRSVSDAWVLGKDAITTIDSCSLSAENAVATENEPGLEGFGDVVEEIQWDDDDFLCRAL